MARYIWTLFAGFVLGIYAVFYVAVHTKTFRKSVIDMLAKVMVDWIYGTRPETARAGHQYKYGAKSFQDRPAYNPHQLMREVIDTHQNTVDLLLMMDNIVAEQGHFSVFDLKMGLGLPGTFIDQKYGWKTTEGVLFFSKGDDESPWILETKQYPEPI